MSGFKALSQARLKVRRPCVLALAREVRSDRRDSCTRRPAHDSCPRKFCLQGF
jgi:hypothetical protein